MNGNILINNGWARSGSTYTKGEDIIIYDGCYWFLNGKRILDDYSEYLKQPGMLDYIEKEWLEHPEIHNLHASIINGVIEKYKINTVVEIGCGTGNVAKLIKEPDPFIYIGYDSNNECINIAGNKNQSIRKIFRCEDIRKMGSYAINGGIADLVFCFGFLKHFGLHEWCDIFQRVVSFGQYFVFDMPISDEVKDDGTDYHHIWVTSEWIKEECSRAGIKVIGFQQTNKDEYCFITKRI